MTETTSTETTPSNNKKYKVGDRTTLIGKIEFYGGISFAVYFTLFFILMISLNNLYNNKIDLFIRLKYYICLITLPISLCLLALTIFYTVKMIKEKKYYNEHKPRFRRKNEEKNKGKNEGKNKKSFLFPLLIFVGIIIFILFVILLTQILFIIDYHNYVFKYNKEQKKLFTKIILSLKINPYRKYFIKSPIKNVNLFNTNTNNNNKNLLNKTEIARKAVLSENLNGTSKKEIRKIVNEYSKYQENYRKKLKQKIKEIEQQKKNN